MKKYIFLLLLFCSQLIFATAQAPDRVIYNGTQYKLNTNPLEQYFELHPEKRPKVHSRSSNLWRGYIALFEIKEKKLFLKDIFISEYDTIKREETEISVYNETFGDTSFECQFYSGLLTIPYGEQVEYVHMGYASLYENYYLIELEKGSVLKQKQFNTKEYLTFKRDFFIQFKKTEAYQKEVSMFKEVTKVNENDPFLNEMFKDEKGRKGKRNKYLEEKEKKWEEDKMIDNFIWMNIDSFINKLN